MIGASVFGDDRPRIRQNLSAMSAVGTLWAIVDLLSTSTADVEWQLWRPDPGGDPEKRTEVVEHLSLQVLNQPNPFYTRWAWMESGQQHIELTGEGWTVVTKNAAGWPQQLWPIRPDRIEVVPSRDEFIAGYVYTSPDGEKVPLGVGDVLRIVMPDPDDPYRGLGPVQSILTDAKVIRNSTDWNANFFGNGAEPGGIIELDSAMDDVEWDRFRRRWNEGHRGVANAHRVALLERGKWVDRKYTHDDMQFAQLSEVSRDRIREAFAIHGHMLGDADDVNLANATAAEVTFARRKTRVRAKRWRAMLNGQYLPMFGPNPTRLYYDFVDPVAEDEASAAGVFLERARGVALLTPLGFDPPALLAAAGLPDIPYVKPEPVVPPALAGAAADVRGGQGPQALAGGRHRLALAAAVTTPDDVDLTPVQEAWQHATDQLVGMWRVEVTPRQVRALADGIATAIDRGVSDDVGDLDQVEVDTTAGQDLVVAASVALAAAAAGHVVQEAARQGVTVAAGVAGSQQLADWASVTCALLAAGLRLSAVREALRVAAPGMSGVQVADKVTVFLAGLSDVQVREQLGGVLTAAQNAGRFATFEQSTTEVALYASEQLDKNTCVNCRAVDGRWLGSAAEMAQVTRMYPSSGYVDCLGGARCRGTVVGIWRKHVGQEDQ